MWNPWPLTAAARPAPEPPLKTVVVPAARDRWLAAGLTDLTPEQIYSTLRGALSGDLLQVWRLFDVMEDTWPRLSVNLAKVRAAVKRHDWTLQAWAPLGSRPSAEALRRARMLGDAIWSMRPAPDLDELGWEGTLDALMDAWGKGVSVLEVDWELRDTAEGAFIAPRCTHWVHPRYYGWPSEDRPEGDRLMLRASEVLPRSQALGPAPQDWLPFPPRKFILAVCKARTAHAAAAARLRQLAWWWCVSNFSGQWLVNYAQLFGVPIRWATYDPARPDLRPVLEQMLERMGSAGWAVMPEGTSLTLHAAPGGAAENPQLALLQLADRICDVAILGQTLTTDVGASGSRALGEVHKEVQDEIVQAAIRWLASTLNEQLLPAWCELNWGDRRECPYFLDRAPAERDTRATAETFEVVLRSGVPIPRDFYYEQLGIPQPEPDQPVIMPPSTAVLPPSPLPDPAQARRPGAPPAPPPAALGAAYFARQIQNQALADHVLEDLTGIEAAWLGGARPWLARLVEAAQDPKVSDAEFLELLERARRNVPSELAPLLHPEAVSEALERALGAACVNGALEGFRRRRLPAPGDPAA
jgi:phage gp29-like protein